MNKLKRRSAVALLLLAVGIVFGSIEPLKAQTEKIRNGGFEAGDFSYWSIGDVHGIPSFPIIQSSDVHSGTYGVAFTYGHYIEQKSPSGYGIKASSALTFWSFSGWLSPSNGHCVWFGTQVVYSDGTIDGGACAAEVIAGPIDGWYQFSLPVNQEKSIVLIVFACSGQTQNPYDVFLDDISLDGTYTRLLMGLRPFPWLRTRIPGPIIENFTTEVANVEAYPVSFNYTMYTNMYSNVTFIDAQGVSNLSPNETATLTWQWNTTGFAVGTYIISFYVYGENLTNYNCLNVTVSVTIPGDLSGDFAVGLTDLVLLANAYGSSAPDYLQWNPDADINFNGIVDLADLVLLAAHYAQHYP